MSTWLSVAEFFVAAASFVVATADIGVRCLRSKKEGTKEKGNGPAESETYSSETKEQTPTTRTYPTSEITLTTPNHTLQGTSTNVYVKPALKKHHATAKKDKQTGRTAVTPNVNETNSVQSTTDQHPTRQNRKRTQNNLTTWATTTSNTGEGKLKVT